MRSFLNELIQQVEVLSMTEILTQILVAAALGFVIYLSYYMLRNYAERMLLAPQCRYPFQLRF